MCLDRIKEWLKKISEEIDTPEMPTPLSNTFLFVEPMKHYLDYSSTVLHQLIAENKSSGQVITELIGDNANAENVWATLASQNPIVFAMCGHGNYTTTTVECTQFLMKVGDDNISKFKDRIVHLNSCQTGAELGPALVNTGGADAYVGSNESFWFYVGDAPNASRAVKSPFLAEWQFIVSLLRGKTVGEARTDHLKKYEEELSYWVEGEGKTHPDAGELARIINLNKTISTFIGESGTQPSPSGGGGAGGFNLPPEVSVPAVFAVAGLGLWWLLKK